MQLLSCPIKADLCFPEVSELYMLYPACLAGIDKSLTASMVSLLYNNVSLSLSDPRRFFLRLHRRNTLQHRRLHWHVSSYLGPLRLNIPLRHFQRNRECISSFVSTSPSPCRLPNTPGLLLSTPSSFRSAASIAQNHPAGYVMHIPSMSSA
jgi:hypothetical protein